MFINISPLKNYRDFRLLFFSQLISFFGSMITYVAIPYQVYALTKSSLLVGFLGIAQLVPVVLFGLIGGAVADSMDRRKLLLMSESIMSLGALGLLINSMLSTPSVVAVFVLTVFMQAANGFHRPALEALNQKLVEPKDYPSISALGAFKHSVGAVVGPALGGVLIATLGAKAAYTVDFLTFIIALSLIYKVKKIPPAEAAATLSLKSFFEGLNYAWNRPILLGSYVIDIIAMTFAFPMALFPALGDQWGGAKAAGYLFSAMSVGSLVMTLLSGWASKFKRHGRGIIISATLWGFAIVGVGFSRNLETALFFLILAGAADMLSGLYRGTIWNETIPNSMRGRMAGVEMISYMTGPLIGNARAGWVATVTTPSFSIYSGGILCVVGVITCALFLPQFWRYRSQAS